MGINWIFLQNIVPIILQDNVKGLNVINSRESCIVAQFWSLSLL